ncbi:MULTISPECIES: ABC transporter permease [Pseudomonas]|jgi:polar amino acid transport system permease protein|uniref:Arginine ABC transporter permease protein ArtM n=2 Tax=Pseudomonas TaxID=286 RepID=A0A923FXE5_9PSED|nr:MULTISPECIES: ABC transporter permease subunit [Pseudomonas]MBV4535684.1 ABC transporter permease subunit [Pseudomonas urmiensis]OAS04531.1 ABC transporter permease [Pseudomonas putida]QOJ89544.1 ABC transporter permease subunit [Pseudomonas taiwanensis]WQQ35095.1 ABC transporter permease subunit [Pseudomonas putida]HEN8731775.1 ABC transporter permease subunit [Pseudomonas putida]
MELELLSTYGPRMLAGLGMTLKIVLLSVALGALLSLPLAAARMSRIGWLRRLAFCYTYLFRGTPLLAQTFLVYYGAGQLRPELQELGVWWFFRDAYWCTVLTFTLNTAAYQAEIWRGAVQAVPQGQWEVAHALGLSRLSGIKDVIVPQAFVVALRPLSNELILMLKSSAIASVIAVPELMGMTSLAFSRSFDFQVYLWAAVLYLSLVESIRRLCGWISNRITRHITH